MLGSMPALAADPIAVSAEPAHEAPTKDESTEPKATWYGWQTLLADAGSAVLVAFGVELVVSNTGTSDVLAVGFVGAGLAGYVLGGPLIHWGHDRNVIAYADFSMRLGVPLLLGQLGALTTSGSNDLGCAPFCGNQGDSFGKAFLVGVVTSVIVDAFGLSWGYEAPKASSAHEPRLRWRPMAEGARGGAVGGIGGTF